MQSAAVSLDVNLVYLERSVEDRGALLLWPAEGGEVEAQSPSAARGHCTDVITTTPWAQSTQSTRESTRSTSNPLIANEGAVTFVKHHKGGPRSHPRKSEAK
ncbi:hypothetical protein Taro_052398 [Colocasia esculenta]|uniref:Uncharacterized protein n=1 Tax=Colocasia esculenta TaxID=4460 RepID=A0A843XIH6_COLES|nr:hypothetical protein [Colocasia esculenta]